LIAAIARRFCLQVRANKALYENTSIWNFNWLSRLLFWHSTLRHVKAC
jgi:hypothetical protein